MDSIIILSMRRRPRISTFFPYTTLFRSPPSRPAAAAKPAARPGAHEASGGDLDFSSLGKASAPPRPAATPTPSPMEQTSALAKAREEAEAKAAADKDRMKKEAEAKARAEMEAKARAE